MSASVPIGSNRLARLRLTCREFDEADRLALLDDHQLVASSKPEKRGGTGSWSSTVMVGGSTRYGQYSPAGK
jgi:phage replication-related protein YjqB (UPF0714/DUF867 family)